MLIASEDTPTSETEAESFYIKRGVGWKIITTLFVGCKQGGRSKNVSNKFDPFVFFPDGEGYMMLYVC